MRATLRWALVVLVCGACACATGADPESVPTGVKSDAAVIEDGAVASDAPAKDTTVATDTNPPPADSGEPAADTAVVDTATPVDTSVPDTTPLDTGTPDTGTVMMDTGTVMDTTPPVCAPSGEYGGTCVTNADCAAKGCGYVCCAYDPFTGTIPIGCGRTAFGGTCLP